MFKRFLVVSALLASGAVSAQQADIGIAPVTLGSEPYLFDTPFGLTTSGYYYNRAYAEYIEDRYGGRITLDRRLDPIWTATSTSISTSKFLTRLASRSL